MIILGYTIIGLITLAWAASFWKQGSTLFSKINGVIFVITYPH